ncbi:MAG: phosphatidylserine decarboxylase [Thermoplasmata archaeon]
MFAPQGRRILIPLFLLLLLSLGLSVLWKQLIILSLFLIALLLFFAWFFRDPERNIGKGIVAPADGMVLDAGESEGGKFVSIFMNIHDVHVNRAPEDGKILKVTHFPGKHRVASGKEVRENEHTVIEIASSHGRLRVVQIAGIFARRIRTYVKPGDFVRKGERIGMIFLGSRVETYLPGTAILCVKKGDRVRAGESTIGVWKEDVDKENLSR